MLPCFHVFGIAKLCPELKTTFFIFLGNKYIFQRKTTWHSYTYHSLSICKKEANLIFSALPEICDFV